MISGDSLRILFLLFFCAGGLSGIAMAQTASWGLPQLMSGMAAVKSASATFTERKTLPMLNAPLVEAGSLSYAAPDWMEKITVSPPERFVLNGQQVTLTGGADGQAHVISLNDDPRIGGLAGGILATLSGNLPALEQVYTVRFSGGPVGWQLLLRPKDPDLARFISWMCISGSFNRIAAIDTASGDGGHSEMSVAETVSDAR
jgi:outer membrane lipoprotein-sorting protein